jgi:glycosyltransferase involved in cell wall biosynthesis
LIANYLIPRADCIRVVSKRLKDGLMNKYDLTNEPIILPIHLEIPLNMLSDRSNILRIKYPKFATIAVMISRLEKEKNFFMVLNAFRNLALKYPGVGLVIVGEGSMREKLEKTIVKLNLENRVIFEGWRENVIPYFLSADIFLSASNYEGYGRTLIEAATAGCPIVTTDVGVIGESISSKNSLVSAPQNLEQFQANFEYAINHPKEMLELASNARRATARDIELGENERLAVFKSSWEACCKI